MLSPEGQKLVHWILTLPPGINPYLATSDYLKDSLKVHCIPTWSKWIERIAALGFLVIFVQSVYVLYIRLKTKKFISSGSTHIDRANHMGLCYLLFSAAAILDKVCRDLVLAGYLDRRYSIIFSAFKYVFMAWAFCGEHFCADVVVIQFRISLITFGIDNPSVFQWLCVCNWALLKWKHFESHPTEMGYFMPPILLSILNGCIVLLTLWTTVSTIWVYFQLLTHYNSMRIIVNATMHSLSASAPTYAIKTYKPIDLIDLLIPLKELMPLQDIFAHYARVASTLSLITCVILTVTYMPFLFLTCQSILKPHGFSDVVKKQQRQILIHAITEFLIVVSTIVILIYMLHFPGSSFLHSPGYWIAFHTTFDLVLSIGVNISIFLVRCTTSSTNHINHIKDDQDDQDHLVLEKRQEFSHETVKEGTLEGNPVEFNFNPK